MIWCFGVLMFCSDADDADDADDDHGDESEKVTAIYLFRPPNGHAVQSQKLPTVSALLLGILRELMPLNVMMLLGIFLWTYEMPCKLFREC